MKLLLAILAIFCVIKGIFAICIFTKAEWRGRAAIMESSLDKNLAYVIIHHSAGAYCNTTATCSAQMRNIQSYHMDSMNWTDIGYNYAIGGDGSIYAGRGAGILGTHSLNWNSKSYGIMFIGNYNNYSPTAAQIIKAKELIAWLVLEGYVASNYTLYGHRQVRATECPGNNLYDEIKTWSHWKDVKK